MTWCQHQPSSCKNVLTNDNWDGKDTWRWHYQTGHQNQLRTRAQATSKHAAFKNQLKGPQRTTWNRVRAWGMRGEQGSDSVCSSESLKAQQKIPQESRKGMAHREAGRYCRDEGRKDCGVIRNENGQNETLLKSQIIRRLRLSGGESKDIEGWDRKGKTSEGLFQENQQQVEKEALPSSFLGLVWFGFRFVWVWCEWVWWESACQENTNIK